MVTLRLARAGTKKRPVYHLVATNSRDRRDGRFIENLGYFIPNRDVLVLKHDRIAYWKGVGATLSDTASELIKKSAKAAPAAGAS
jgi:small subunit ribosomal protein S16